LKERTFFDSLKYNREGDFRNLGKNKFREEKMEEKVIVEQTSKKLKLHVVISVLIALIGFLIGGYYYLMYFLKGVNGEKTPPQIIGIIGAVIFGIGILYYLIVKFIIWWQHK